MPTTNWTIDCPPCCETGGPPTECPPGACGAAAYCWCVRLVYCPGSYRYGFGGLRFFSGEEDDLPHTLLAAGDDYEVFCVSTTQDSRPTSWQYDVSTASFGPVLWDTGGISPDGSGNLIATSDFSLGADDPDGNPICQRAYCFGGPGAFAYKLLGPVWGFLPAVYYMDPYSSYEGGPVLEDKGGGDWEYTDNYYTDAGTLAHFTAAGWDGAGCQSFAEGGFIDDPGSLLPAAVDVCRLPADGTGDCP